MDRVVFISLEAVLFLGLLLFLLALRRTHGVRNGRALAGSPYNYDLDHDARYEPPTNGPVAREILRQDIALTMARPRQYTLKHHLSV